MQTMLDTFDADPKLWKYLQAIKSDQLKFYDVFSAYDLNQLNTLPTIQGLLPLRDSLDQYVTSLKKSDSTKIGYQSNYKQLYKLAASDATIQDLPTLLKDYRTKCETDNTDSSFNHTKSAVLSYLKNTVGKKHELYQDVSEIDDLSTRTKKKNTAKTFKYIMSIRDKLSTPNQHMLNTLVTTGMGWKEYQHFEIKNDDGVDYIAIHGTKTVNRDRMVPLIQTPVKPSCHQKTFWLAIQNASNGDMTVYDLRHTYASWLIAAGVDKTRVEQYMGHAPQDQTTVYIRGKVVNWLVEDAELVKQWMKEQLADIAKPTPIVVTPANVLHFRHTKR